VVCSLSSHDVNDINSAKARRKKDIMRLLERLKKKLFSFRSHVLKASVFSLLRFYQALFEKAMKPRRLPAKVDLPSFSRTCDKGETSAFFPLLSQAPVCGSSHHVVGRFTFLRCRSRGSDADFSLRLKPGTQSRRFRLLNDWRCVVDLHAFMVHI